MKHSYQKPRKITLLLNNNIDLISHIEQLSMLKSVLYIGSSNDELFSLYQKDFKQISCISYNQVNQYLGQEIQGLIFNASGNFDVNSFAAISGCLIGGGELLLILPESFSSIINNTSLQEIPSQILSPLLVRLVNKILQQPHMQSNMQSNNNDKKTLADKNEELEINIDPQLTEQQQTIDKIKRCVLGHAKRPLVITADRGRGKSAAIGIAVADLIYENNKHFIITSPRKQNTHIFFQHFEQQYYKQLQGKKKNIIPYFPPDQLLDNEHKTDCLIIDEASAIPIQLLEKIISKYNRIIFSTTINGYEGNGNGFNLRLLPLLQKIFPQYKQTTLKTPLRWVINDPLEHAINSAFLLNSNEKTLLSITSTTKPLNSKKLHYKMLSQQMLLNNEDLLSQIFSLLIEAHYQTRPSDLERILADDSIKVFVAMNNDEVIAASLIATEGKLSPNHCEKIVNSELRLSGHLLPQSLMAHQGHVQAGELLFWRVMRIAVRASFQRKNIGSQLIQFINQTAVKNHVDIVGTSFSISADILEFWYQLKFNCSRIALRKDSSTGSYPTEFFKLINQNNSTAKKCVKDFLHNFQQSFAYLLTAHYKKLPASNLTQILDYQLDYSTINLSTFQMIEVNHYLKKHRSLEMVEWTLNQYVLRRFKSNSEELNNDIRELLIAKTLQNKSWQSIVDEFNFNGKKEAKEAVRLAVQQLKVIN